MTEASGCAIVYLDTNHVSQLARKPDDADVKAVLELFESGEAVLGFSLVHLYELSDPGFVSRPEVGALLDGLPIVWPVNLADLFDHEIEATFKRTYLQVDERPTIFYDRPDIAWGMDDPNAVIPVSEMLEVFAERPDFRNRFAETAKYGAVMDAMKVDATVVQERLEPLLSRLRDMTPPATPSGLTLPDGYPGKEFIDAAGGIEGFPAYNVFQSLTLTRLRDRGFKPDPNDLVDEWHACYLPYVSVIALDRTTVGRCRTARLPQIEHVTHSLGDVPELLFASRGQ